MSDRVTAEELEAAEALLLKTKAASQDAPNSNAKREAYQEATDEVVRLRIAFREQSGATGFVTGDAETKG